MMNVLVILTDQQRWDALGAMGNSIIRTPHLDRLASEGMLFRNAFCNSPVCMPSRISLFTGRYPGSLGIACNGIDLPRNVPTLADVLRGNAYRTANLGKLHFTSHSNRDHKAEHPDYGFDVLELSDEPGCYEDAYICWVRSKDPGAVEACRCDTPPAWKGPAIANHDREDYGCYAFEGPEHLTHSAFVAERTCGFLERHGGSPFFCVAGFYAPHEPLNPPRRFLDLYERDRMPLPERGDAQQDAMDFSDEKWQEIKQHYYALVSHVDEEVGRILDKLDETGLRDNTLVVFTSDHGEHLGDHGLVQKGAPGYDSCVHVPLIVRLPGCEAADCDELVELVDLAPTILEACGIGMPDRFQGRSLLSLLKGRSGPHRDSVLIEFHAPGTTHHWKTLRTHRHKYCLSAGGEERLFDLEEDPAELRNRAGAVDCQAALNDMRSRLLARWFETERPSLPRNAVY